MKALQEIFADLDSTVIRGEDKAQQRRTLSWFYAAAEKHKLTFNNSKNTAGVKLIKLL